MNTSHKNIRTLIETQLNTLPKEVTDLIFQYSYIPFEHPPSIEDICSLPNYGYYHSLIERMRVRNKLYKMSIQEISNYSDYVTRSSLNQKWFIEGIKDNNEFEDYDYNYLGTTHIGNIAYLSLYLEDEEVRNLWIKNFNILLAYERKKNGSVWKKGIIVTALSIMLGITVYKNRNRIKHYSANFKK